MTATLTRSLTFSTVPLSMMQLQDIAQYGANAGVSGFIYALSYIMSGKLIFPISSTMTFEEYADSCFDKSWEAMIVDQRRFS